MHESVLQVYTYARMVWRNRWLALAAVLLVCIAGWIGVILMPNKYEVKATIFLDTQSMLRPLLKGLAVDSTLSSQSALMMRRMLLTRPNLEKVVRETDMDLEIESPEQKELALDRMMVDITVSGTKKDNIYIIAYKHTDPQMAKRVVDALLNIFVESTLGATRRDTEHTRQFLDEQIREYEKKLEEAEARLTAFKRKHIGQMPSEGGNYYARLQANDTLLRQARLELSEARNQRDALKGQLADIKRIVELPGPEDTQDVPSPLDERITGLEDKLDELLLHYTAQHPDVIATRRVLEQLREKKARELASLGGEVAIKERRLTENPVYQNLKVALGTVEATVAALEARVSEYEARSAELLEKVDTIPQVEAELTRVNRDYEIIKGQYLALVSRREKANLSREAERSADKVQFNVIEPPRIPLVPVSPNRLVLHTVVLVLGVGAGVGLAFFVSQMRPAVYSGQVLRELTGMPLLGSISRIRSPEYLAKKKLEYIAIGVSGVVLLSLYAGLMLLSLNHIDLADSLLGLKDRVL